jgi:hypothetical protein
VGVASGEKWRSGEEGWKRGRLGIKRGGENRVLELEGRDRPANGRKGGGVNRGVTHVFETFLA